MIPRKIDASHIHKAAGKIDKIGVPFARSSRAFDVAIDGKRYPPKYLLSVAAILATNRELPAGRFITTEARQLLKRLGFKVVEKRKARRKTVAPIVVSIPSFVICWDNVECRDVIPVSWLRDGPPLIGVVHEMRDACAHLKGRAKCDVKVESGQAFLDYRPYRKLNRHNQVEFGVTQISFTRPTSPNISSIKWRPEDSPDDVGYGKVEVPILQAENRKPYVRPKGKAKKRAAFKRERPGQVKFRNALKSAYGHRCCICRCGVPETPDGAHIDSYRSPASDHLNNGLLLRRDIHALFDNHLISVDPETGLVAIAANLRGTEYEDYHNATLLPPANPVDRPDTAAIMRHFEAFKVKNG